METKTLKLAVEKAVEAYKQATPDQKILLINLYGKEPFQTDVKERVVDYTSACKELNISPLTRNHFNFLPEEDQDRAWNRHILSVVTRALVGDWKPNFKDSTYKYYNYFYWDNSKNGFSSGVDDSGACSIVGSDLMFPSEDLAKYAKSICERNYIAYHFNA